MTTAVCPGSFDPVTLGHLDLIERARALFDEVVVGVAHNAAKRALLDVATRRALLVDAVAGIPGVRVEVVPGLLAEFCKVAGANAIVKGLRGGADLEFEAPMAAMNRHLTGVETVYLPADTRYTHVSSSLIKEVHGLGGDVAEFVPAAVLRGLDGGA